MNIKNLCRSHRHDHIQKRLAVLDDAGAEFIDEVEEDFIGIDMSQGILQIGRIEGDGELFPFVVHGDRFFGLSDFGGVGHDVQIVLAEAETNRICFIVRKQ